MKTLNAIVGGLSTEVLLNQFTQSHPHNPIWVFESNQQLAVIPLENTGFDRLSSRVFNLYLFHFSLRRNET